MKIAITGSSGLIGAAVSRALTRRGDTVIRVIRPGSAGPGIHWDPQSRQIDREGLNGLDAVVHLAGAPIFSLWTAGQKRRILESRVQGTTLLAEALAQLNQPPRVLVCASAIGFYGNRPPDQPVDETDAKGSGFLADVVALWEAAAAPAKDAGIRIVNTRFGLVLGKDGGTLMVAVPPFYLGLGARLGSGRQVWSWVTLPDVVGGVLHVIDNPVAGPVNVVAPHPVNNAEFTRVLAEVMRRPAFLAVPEFLLKLGGEMVNELILSGVRVVPRRLQESGYRFRHPELRPALQAVLAGDVGS
jgi:uncharacterized protein (TIGR01777 family)